VLTLPSGEFDAFIFDCDGTLADSMPLYHRAWRTALARSGATFDFSWDLFVSRAGMTTMLTVEGLNSQFGTRLDAATIESHQHAEYALLVDEVKPIDAVVKLAREYAGRLPMSVASGGTRVLVERTLAVLGIRELFDHVLVASDVPRGKPEPDLFLLAAKKMGVAPERCLVFEDGEPGIVAAHRAGMQVVRVELGSRT
jgi:HAD superfamily hydrolase (TIGR01509 family)